MRTRNWPAVLLLIVCLFGTAGCGRIVRLARTDSDWAAESEDPALVPDDDVYLGRPDSNPIPPPAAPARTEMPAPTPTPWWKGVRVENADTGTESGAGTAPVAATLEPGADFPAEQGRPGMMSAGDGLVPDEKGAAVSRGRRFRVGEKIGIALRGIPQELEVTDVIDQRGCIKLPYVGTINIGGLTPREVEELVERAYIQGGIYKRVDVSVFPPERAYFMRGEIRGPGRYPLTAEITFLQAIAIAGGYTEYANSGKIRVIREGSHFFINGREIEKHPEKDQKVHADDVILVPRSFF